MKSRSSLPEGYNEKKNHGRHSHLRLGCLPGIRCTDINDIAGGGVRYGSDYRRLSSTFRLCALKAQLINTLSDDYYISAALTPKAKRRGARLL
jgi:hypothetical protein